jgi:nucleoside-diphosphate-sugar epimerase
MKRNEADALIGLVHTLPSIPCHPSSLALVMSSRVSHYPRLAGKRVAITGGGGYVGQRIAAHLLLADAAFVRLLDIAPSPIPPSPYLVFAHCDTAANDNERPTTTTTTTTTDIDQHQLAMASELLASLMAERTEFQLCDIRFYEQVLDALANVDVVFHVASFGMSGRDQLNKELVTSINVQGTRHVLQAARHHRVQALCYTSTTNVCFHGEALVNADESVPYAPMHKHVDYYSMTKCIAEKIVLQQQPEQPEQPEQQGSASEHYLQTCAIRPAGIYGEGEQRHLPRIVSLIRKGMFCFTIGAAESLVEFVYIDNLVHAHLLAVDQLLQDRSIAQLTKQLGTDNNSNSNDNNNISNDNGHADGNGRCESQVNGCAFFVSDCEPINNFEFFRPLLEGLGYSFPRIRLPFLCMYYLAYAIEVCPSAPHCLSHSATVLIGQRLSHNSWCIESLVVCTTSSRC